MSRHSVDAYSTSPVCLYINCSETRIPRSLIKLLQTGTMPGTQSPCMRFRSDQNQQHGSRPHAQCLMAIFLRFKVEKEDENIPNINKARAYK